MRLSPPTKVIFLVSLVFFVIGVLNHFGVYTVPIVAAWAFLVAWVVLAAGCVLKGI